jgi:hypothetical protein
MRQFTLLALILSVTACTHDQPARRGTIRVEANGFEAREADIAKVCLSAVGELQKFCPELPTEDVVIVRGTKGPITLFRRNDRGEVVVKLDTGKTYWSQYAYQVAHEFGHVHCGFRPGPQHNQWFEESVCETASLFCLRAMAKTWATQPPYPHWASYAPALAKYADDVIAQRTYKAEFASKGLARFYRDHAAEFRAKSTERELNGAIALALLAYLEEKPERWAAFRWLNATPRPDDEPFAAYLRRWERNTPKEHQATVQGIQKLFGL